MSMWNAIKPYRLKPQDDGAWSFASYVEFPSERDDGQWYEALLFRSTDGTVFGVREFRGSLVPGHTLRKMATKVVLDARYRKSLISDDPWIKKMWRGR